MHATRIASRLRRGGTAALAAAALAGSGCLGTSPDTNHYALDPVATEAAPASGLALGVGPVRLPGELDQPQIAMRVGEAEVRYDEFNRWASGLEDQVTRALAESLGTLLGTSRIAIYPALAPFPLDYRVLVDVTAIHARRGEEVTLRARWIVSPGPGGDALAVEQSTLREPLASSDVEELVRGHRAVVAALSREIASRIRALAR